MQAYKLLRSSVLVLVAVSIHLVATHLAMGKTNDSSDAAPAPPAGVAAASHTTSAEDQANVAALKARLEGTSGEGSSSGVAAAENGAADAPYDLIPRVEIAPGAHKYVLIVGHTPTDPPEQRWFVTSKSGAKYHANAAEPFVHRLEEAGYRDIRVTGGGRINYQPDQRIINIFGYSYGFGLADHKLSKQVVEEDGRFAGYSVDWSNEGY